MKKSILMMTALVICVALIASPAMAQTKFNLGITAGVAMSNGTAKDSAGTKLEGNKMKLGLAAGVFFRIIPSEQICIQPEILYVMKGPKFDDAGDVTGLKFDLNYIEIPVLVKYMFKTEGNFKPNIFAGPYVGILASAKAKGSEGGVSASVDIKDNFKSTDFGAAFGVGFDYKVGESGLFTFDARYSLGLTNIAKDPVGDQSWKNNCILVKVGYAFEMGNKGGAEPKK
jgi:outer membrane protein W